MVGELVIVLPNHENGHYEFVSGGVDADTEDVFLVIRDIVGQQP